MGCTDGWTDGRMDELMDGWMNGWKDGWNYGWMDANSGLEISRCILLHVVRGY